MIRLGRRDFLKEMVKGLGAFVLAGSPLTSVQRLVARLLPARNGQTPATDAAGESQHLWGFVVDTEKCIGCGRCVEACKEENNVPQGEFYRTWVERYVVTEDGEVLVDSPEGGIHGFNDPSFNTKHKNLKISKSFFVPKLCNQCENTPCVQVCPVSATYRTEDGVILVDRERCIGCRYCIQACPYGARFLDPRIRVADKCTWCYHRISNGRQPACVEVCPVGARLFGDLNNPESSVRKAMKEKRTEVLKPALGTKPKVYYVGIGEGVR